MNMRGLIRCASRSRTMRRTACGSPVVIERNNASSALRPGCQRRTSPREIVVEIERPIAVEIDFSWRAARIERRGPKLHGVGGGGGRPGLATLPSPASSSSVRRRRGAGVASIDGVAFGWPTMKATASR